MRGKSKIHSTAIVHKKARIGAAVEIGPYAVVDEHVTIGAGCRLDAHCVITGHTEIGLNNQVGVGAVIGLEPQDFSYKGEKSFVKIGDRNKIREYVQIHRGAKEGTVTRVGNDNFLLGFSHIAHDCKVDNNTIIANGALLAGHVEVEDFVFISGHCLIHQFCHLGKHAMMRGGARVSLDIPPYCIADDSNALRGINSIGLERRGFTPVQIKEIRKMYRQIFTSELTMEKQIETVLAQDLSAECRVLAEFIKNSPRGVCRPQT